jgi:hypothetical protein
MFTRERKYRALELLARLGRMPGGTVVVPLLVGGTLLGLASLYVTPATTCINHGCLYAELADSPWGLHPSNPLRLRWFSPFVAHYLGLTGGRYIVLPLLALLAFLAGVYAWSRSNGYRPSTSVGMTAAMASTMPVVYTLHFEGYSDAMSWLLLLAAMASIRRPWLWPLAMGAALLNHESTSTALPAMALFCWARRPGLRSALIGTTAAIAIAVACMKLRSNVLTGSVASAYVASSYLNVENARFCLKQTVKLMPLGAFMAFKLLWYLPIAAIFVHLRDRRWLEALTILGFIAGATSLMLVAGDTTRLFVEAFPAILLGATGLRDHLGEAAFDRLLWKLVLFGLLVPTFFVAWEAIIPFLPLPVTWLFEHVFSIDVAKRWWLDVRYN